MGQFWAGPIASDLNGVRTCRGNLYRYLCSLSAWGPAFMASFVMRIHSNSMNERKGHGGFWYLVIST